MESRDDGVESSFGSTHSSSSTNSMLVITGESGLGKSSLVAYLVEYYQRKRPAAFIIEHYVGAGGDAARYQ